MDAMNVKSVSDYIERRYNSLVTYLDKGLAGRECIRDVLGQCFGVVDYFNMTTHDAHYDEIETMWEMWSKRFDDLYGRGYHV